ncbi:ORF putative E7 [human papillomavirus 59]|uniref:Protein E7 n=1 Tax=Human papillomavirus 59 TaxID=37115 RepID=Q81965_HPV59|nr:E7 [human papillomavirus 59]WAB53467.1 E7 [human papillomavirus 59]CAA54850.1 ORF putative E7 [human papillomavirus 59]CAD1814058.1 E7 [human papillomavirus 59]
MHGPKATLCDIVLDLEPQNYEEVDLVCYEQLPDSDSENEKDEPDGVNHPLLLARRAEPQRHNIVCVCCKCNNQLQLVVETSQDGLRALQQLFMDTLSFVCPLCAANQ